MLCICMYTVYTVPSIERYMYMYIYMCVYVVYVYLIHVFYNVLALYYNVVLGTLHVM